MSDFPIQIPAEVQAAKERAAELARTATDYKAGEFSVADKLTEKIREAFSYNKDIIEKLDNATREYFSAPSEAREKYQNIFNPFQRENLVSQYVGNQALPMLSQASVLGSRMGGISDMVRSGVAGYQAESARAQGAAGLAQDEYRSALDNFQLLNQLQRQAEEMKLNREKFDYDKSVTERELALRAKTAGSGGGSGTAAERNRNRLIGEIKNEASRGVNLTDLIWRYSDDLSFNDILSTYNSSSMFGEAGESAEELRGIYNSASNSGEW